MCFDPKKRRLRRNGFTFAMVEQAMTESAVTVPWLRADNFIAEIARSRNLVDLLAEPRRAGFSIRAGSGDEIGIWVPESDPAAIHNAKSIGAVRIADVKAAIPVDVSARQLSSIQSAIPSLLDCQAVQRALWRRDLKEVHVERDTFDFAEAADLRVEIAMNGRRRQRVSVVLSTVKGAVTKERLSRAARRDGCSEVLLFRPLTARHIFIGRYSACDAEPREDAACVFVCAAV
jgi:hypothetical protein